jgi:acyl-CoA synthetase (AMP-forming)/AMP-acid ligase II
MIFQSPFPAVEIPNQPLTSFLFDHATAYADKPALIDGPSGRTLTFGQLTGAIRLAAAGLAQRGFQKGDVFAIHLPNLPEYAVAFHAVAMLGGIVTTINPLYTPQELAHQLTDSGASYLLTLPMFLESAQKAAAESGQIKEIFVLGEAEGTTPFAELLKSDGRPPAVRIDPRVDVVALPYSSGAGGLLKGVMLTHHNLVANITQCEHMEFDPGLELRQEDVVLGLLPFFHIFGMAVIMSWALRRGATVVTMPRFDMEMFLNLMQTHKITYVHLVPPLIFGLAKHPLVAKFDLSSLRVIVSGAAALSAELEGAVRDRLGVIVTQGYGLTEASPVTHFLSRQPSGKPKPGSIGVLVPNTECKIVDIDTQAALGVRQDGELWVRGPQIMKGYLNQPEATAAMVDSDGWLHTGDIGFCDEDGYFWIVDRLKELIKYKGFQVAPAELEEVLRGHSAVGDVAVIGAPDQEAGEVPKALVVRKGEVSADELIDFVAGKVAPHKKIRAVEFVAEIPRSASGNILRRQLKDREREKPM